jgi:peptidoglycan hydrolase-like protein with peptidoglycan-binding domain
VELAEMHRRLLLASICVAAASALAMPVRGPAALRVSAAPRAQIAGVQVALRTAAVYRGPIDGIAGPLTTRAILTVQRAHRLPPTGRAGPETLRYLGRLGRPSPGSRVLTRGMRGLDVSALQFELRAQGYALSVTGSFDTTTRQLLIRFQRAAGLAADGLAGPATWSALGRAPRPSHVEQPPVRLRRPVTAISRTVAARGGTELFCTYGSAVAAAIAGTVVYAGDRGRGYGYTVVTRDSSDVTVLYGHLSRIDVHRGQRLIAGAMIGLAGWTGKNAAATSLLLELSNHGHVLDPIPALRRGAT